MKTSSTQLIVAAISEQYGAAFQMMENIIINCDTELWADTERDVIISQAIYHVLYYMDYYLARDKEEREQFKAKLGEDLMGERTDGLEWDKVYSKEELLEYFMDIRKKADKRIATLTIDELTDTSVFEWHGSSILSSLLYNLRHIMLHVGALHVRLHLASTTKEPLKWVSHAPLCVKRDPHSFRQ
jgi:hypothetical protein